MGAPCKRRNMPREDLKKRFFKVLSYDPGLTYQQLKQRFGLDSNTITAWKREMENG